METDPYDIIHAAMRRFVTILCEGAAEIEGDPHEDVIALAYAMPPSITETNGIDNGRWGMWRHMVLGWLEDGRAPDVVRMQAPIEVTIMANGVPHTWRTRDTHPVEFSGPFLDTFDSNPEWAATLTAKVISDGLDDGLLVGWYDVRGWDEPENQELRNLASLQTLVDLAGLADNLERKRLLDHVERILDTVEANEADGRGAVL